MLDEETLTRCRQSSNYTYLVSRLLTFVRRWRMSLQGSFT